MNRMPSMTVLILSVVLAAASIARGGYYDQDFTDFAVANYGPTTVTNSDGWVVSHCYVSNAFQHCRMGATNYSGSTLFAYVMSPLLTNGAGSVSWEVKNYQAGDNIYELQYSTNGGASWTWVGTYTNSDYSNWTPKSAPVNTYASVNLRFIKTADPGGPNDRLYIDNIQVIAAASYVVITNITLTPNPPLTDSPTRVSARIVPYAQASNAVASVHYGTASTRAGLTNVLAMAHTGNYYYVTSPADIPVYTQPGLTVKYYINSTFQGVTPLSPTSSPPGSVDYYWYLVRAAPKLYLYPNMKVSGSASTNMILASDYLWQGVITPGASLPTPSFTFTSGANVWGDNNEPVSPLPVYGTADVGGTISVNQTVTNHTSFLFNETNLSYSIQNCSYVNFDAWTNGTTSTYSTYTNSENWVIVGRINNLGADEVARAFINRYGILSPTLPAAQPHYLQSPPRSAGIGSVSFWYRNWNETPTNPATQAAGFTVQKSTNGSAGSWVDINPTVWQTNILSVDWLYFNASVADRKSQYVRIVNTNNTSSQSWLCLDEVVVTDPGATVEITENPRNPTTPLSGQWVDVSIEVAPLGGATNLACTVYFRPEGMQAVAYPMTGVGTSFSARLPPAPPGKVYYYYQCSFDGFNATPTYYPDGAPGQALVYTNLTDPGSAREQDFLPFNVANYGPNTVTNNDAWSVHHCFVSNAFAHCRMGATNYLGTTLYAYAMSPLLAHGFGSISWTAKNYQAGDNTYQVQYSTDGSTWIPLASFTSTDYLTWIPNSVWGGIYEDSYVRIIKTGDPGEPNDRLYLDDIFITPPPSDVVISEPFFSPGYPAKYQPVTVSVSITDRTTNYPAYNHVPTLHYMHSSGATGVVAMTKAGGQTWSAVVPGYPAGVMSYYIRCYFDGYYYTNGVVSEKQSPQYSPHAPPSAAKPDTYHSYTIREFQSDYDYIQVNLSYTNEPVRMYQLNDREWQGILDFGYGTLDPSLTLAGFSWFTQTNYWSGTNEWGDPMQTRLSIPLIGTMSAGASNITLHGLQDGQVVIRFNEAVSNYSVQRCVYQDFNRWPASSEFFEESYSRANVTWYRHNFDTWATNQTYIQPDNFEDATWTTLYNGPGWDPNVDQGPWFWTLRNYKIASHFQSPIGGKCAILKDEANFGDFYSSIHNPIADNGWGVGNIEMDFRCQENNWKPTLRSVDWTNSVIEATLSATVLPESADKKMLAPCWVSILSRYIDPDNYYELRWEQVGINLKKLRLFRKSASGYTLLQEASTSPGYITTTNRLRLLTSSEPGGKVYVEGYLDGTRVLRGFDSAGITQPGSVGIVAKDASIIVTNIFGGWAQSTTFYSNPGWPHLNPGTFDSNIVSQTGWIANRVEATDTANADYWLRLRAWNASGLPPSIQSPPLPNGVGYVHYRYYNSGGNYTMVKTQWSTNLVNWYSLDEFNIASTSQWLDRYFSVTNVPYTNAYIRLLNSTNTLGQTAAIHFDFISIHPSSASGYTEDFRDNAAQGWSEPAGGGGTFWQVYTNAPATNAPPTPRYVRPGYAAQPLKFVIMTAKASDYALLDQESVWVSNAVYSVSNTPYVHFSHPIRWAEHPGTDGEGVYVRIRHTDTAASLVFDNVQMDKWHGDTSVSDTNGWRATEAWIRADPDNPDLLLAYDYYELPTGGLVPDFNTLTPKKSGTINNFLLTPRDRDTDIAFRYRGFVYIPSDGTWTFYLTSDDESKLYIDGSLVVTTTYSQGEKFGQRTLTAGWHAITLGWAQGTGAFSLAVKYQGPGVSKIPIPDSALVRLAGDNVLELRHSRAYTNVYERPYTGDGEHHGQHVRSPYVTNGIGVISFNYKPLLIDTNDRVVFNVEYATKDFTNSWIPAKTWSTTNEGWQYFSWSINSPDAAAVRILHLSTNYQTGMLIDDIEMTDYAARDQFTWVGYNALITPNQTNRLLAVLDNVKGGYLNYDTVNQTAMPPMTNDRPYIQSANLTNGIGEISFWYRAWGGAAPAGNPARIDIVKAPSETTPSSNWLPLCSISNITTTTFAYFTTNFYDPTNHYIRIYSDTTTVGRVCLDNILITEPFGADISMTNLFIDPAIPLNTNSVHVYVDLFDFFLNPQNVAVSLRYYLGPNDWGTLPDGTRYYQGTNQWGTWTGGSTIPMTVVSTNGRYVRYRTTSPIPAQAIDQPVQYYASVSFTGLFSEVASPKSCKQFANPAHYYPTDLNAGRTADRIPYYIVFSCQPGHVWINEINASDDAYWPTAAMQYVELCGRAGANVSNWWIQIYNTGYSQLSWYRVTNPPSLANELNGYGFWVFGDARTTHRDLTMTYNVGSPIEIRVLPAAGGIRLRRSMGAYEHAISYDAHDGGGGPNLVPYGFTYVGPDDDSLDSPLSMYGTGNKLSDFSWNNDTTPYTPGSVNTGQTLTEWGTGDEQNAPPVVITAFWITGGTTLNVRCTGTNGWFPWLFYCTNLVTTPTNAWTLVTTNSTYANGTNQITAPINTNLPIVFYRVVTTNGG